MKLYTINQLISCYNKGLTDAKNDIIDINLLSGFWPIELPSDEEIDDIIEESSYSLEYDTGFKYGAKWVIEQIKKRK